MSFMFQHFHKNDPFLFPSKLSSTIHQKTLFFLFKRDLEFQTDLKRRILDVLLLGPPDEKMGLCKAHVKDNFKSRCDDMESPYGGIHKRKLLFTPFCNTSLLYLSFTLHWRLQGFLPRFLSFHLPEPSIHTGACDKIHTRARDNRHCERESACGRVTKAI